MGAKSPSASIATTDTPVNEQHAKPAKSKNKAKDKDVLATKRRCVSTACIACRKRKSKCDGNMPSCAACASVYGTECVYDPNSDHRRKGVYKKDIDNLKTRNSTLQTLIQGILNYPESEVMDLVRDIRTCDSLDDVAESILARSVGLDREDDAVSLDNSDAADQDSGPKFERELSKQVGKLRLENGSLRFLGGTSNLIYTDLDSLDGQPSDADGTQQYLKQEDAVVSWTDVTNDAELVTHLLNMYFTWHYTYFAILSRVKFFKEFFKGRPIDRNNRRSVYCTPLLVNAMLALGCHFSSWPGARSDIHDGSTAGDHFFREAKRLIIENDEYENPRLATIQAFALMSVREAGCGREAKGWVYSGMGFRMSYDLGLNVDADNSTLDEHEIDARRITFWGCFLIDKCWSNYLGRSPQLPMTNVTVPKIDVFPDDADLWAPWTDSGLDQTHSQPSRTRAVSLHISILCEISNDLLLNFYRPQQTSKAMSKQAEIKRLSDFHTRLEAWRKALPKEMEPREGQLPNVLVMHMFFQLLFIHLFRPFLRYTAGNSPLPAHVSPRKMCTQAAAMISKLLRLYKRTYGLRQICNIAVYIAHSACTIHLLNLPDKDARRDIAHGVRQLEEIGEGWLCAIKTLTVLAIQARKWGITLPEDAAAVLARAEARHVGQSPIARSESAHSGHASPVSQHQAPRVTETVNRPSPGTKFSSLRNPAILNGGMVAPRSNLTAADSPISEHGVYSNMASPNHGLASGTGSEMHSPSNAFLGSDNIFEDSKDWWLKDQSALFDNWSQQGDSFSGYSVGTDMSMGNLGIGMNQMTNEHGMGVFDINAGSDINGVNNMGQMGEMYGGSDVDGMVTGATQSQNINERNGVRYMNFNAGTPNEFNGGNGY